MTDHQEMIQDFIAKNGVTKCPPALATGSEAKRALKAHVAAERRNWRRERASEAALSGSEA